MFGRSITAGLLALLGALAAPVTASAADAAPVLSTGIDVAGMDSKVRPGDDFFKYANGTWLATHEIPADRAAYGNWDMLYDVAEQRLHTMLEKPDAPVTGAGVEQQVRDYYAAFVDEGAIEARGLAPLAPTWQRIARLKDRRALARYLGQTLRADVDVLNDTEVFTPNLFGLWIAQDLDHPERYVPFILQGGLSMPERSYYVDDTKSMADIRAKYATHVAAVFRLIGQRDAQARAQRVIDLEQKIARVHWTREQTSNVLKANNRWHRADFARRAPGLDWAAYFEAAQLPAAQDDIIVWQPSALTGIAALVGSEPLSSWRDYLVYHATEQHSAVLPHAMNDEAFAFYRKTLRGTPEQRPRWKRAVAATNASLGDAVGHMYVARFFSPEAKLRVAAMVEHIRESFRQRIDALEWMAPQTKESAKAKLAALRVGVGYPDHWDSYEGLKIERGDAYGNLERASLFAYRQEIAKLGRPVDRSEWMMKPQTINAVNLPAMNALIFPAAILQPPLFVADGDAAANYGAIGTIIGHEISHSFDDQGAAFDADGRLRNWWTDADQVHFKDSGARLAAQFSAYRPYPDIAVNGSQTLSENIADVAGLSAALGAYRAEAGTHAADLVAGFSGDQRFFLGFAQVWRQKTREPALRMQLAADGHAPSEFRAATVRNLEAWYQAFDVRPGEALYLPAPERAVVW